MLALASRAADIPDDLGERVIGYIIHVPWRNWVSHSSWSWLSRLQNGSLCPHGLRGMFNEVPWRNGL